jgi:hypothetical protein
MLPAQVQNLFSQETAGSWCTLLLTEAQDQSSNMLQSSSIQTVQCCSRVVCLKILNYFRSKSKYNFIAIFSQSTIWHYFDSIVLSFLKFHANETIMLKLSGRAHSNCLLGVILKQLLEKSVDFVVDKLPSIVTFCVVQVKNQILRDWIVLDHQSTDTHLLTPVVYDNPDLERGLRLLRLDRRPGRLLEETWKAGNAINRPSGSGLYDVLQG